MKNIKLFIAFMALLPFSRVFAQVGGIIYRDFDPDSILIYWEKLGPVWIDLDADGEADDLIMKMQAGGQFCIPQFNTAGPDIRICTIELDSLDMILSEVDEEDWQTYIGWHGYNTLGRYSHYGFRIQHEENYYYGWFETYNRIVAKRDDKQIAHFGFDRTAFCTIPNYPLHWGQTDVIGVEENSEPYAFATIHPNPTLGRVTLSGENLRQAEVVNLLGQQVLSMKGQGNEIHIDMTALPAGIYFVTITDEEGRKCVHKVVKE